MNVHASSNTLPELDGFLSTFDLKFRQLGGQGRFGTLFDRSAYGIAQ